MITKTSVKREYCKIGAMRWMLKVKLRSWSSTFLSPVCCCIKMVLRRFMLNALEMYSTYHLLYELAIRADFDFTIGLLVCKRFLRPEAAPLLASRFPVLRYFIDVCMNSFSWWYRPVDLSSRDQYTTGRKVFGQLQAKILMKKRRDPNWAGCYRVQQRILT